MAQQFGIPPNLLLCEHNFDNEWKSHINIFDQPHFGCYAIIEDFAI